MIITGTNLIKGRLDLSSLERLYESNPVERYPFHATIVAGQAIQTDDKFYSLHNIQTALNGGYITITDYNAGGGGTSDHAALSNLDYASAGHTGFLPSTHLTDFAHADIAHANRIALDAVSNVNTGDQDLSSYLQSGDNVSSLLNDAGYSNATAHINDGTIHFTEGSIDHLNIQNIGNNSHAQIDIDLSRLSNTSGLNTGDQDLSNYLQTGNNVSSLLNDAGYITAAGPETDPIYTASSWYTTNNNSASWDSAFSWGNHAIAGYLTEVNAAGIYFTQSNADTHINDGTIHFTEGSVDHLNIQNIGNNSHSQIDQDLARLANTSGLNTGDQDLSTYDSHIGNASIHFTEGSINHNNISNIGTNSHAQIDIDLARLANTSGLNTGDQDLSTYDSHIGDGSIHFTEGSINHNNISNVGTNSHAQIDIDLARLANTSGLNTGDQDLSGYITTESDPLSLHLDQASPQTFSNLGGGTGLMSVTAGVLGLDTNTYVSSSALTGYAKLDGTNQPFTGNITVSKANPKVIATDTGLNSSIWLEKDTTLDGGRLVSQNRVYLADNGIICSNTSKRFLTGPTVTTVSYSFWIKTTTTAWSLLTGEGNSAVTIYFNGNSVNQRFQFIFGTIATTWGSINFNDGNWHHLVVSSTSGAIPILYLDGVLQTASASNATSGSVLAWSSFFASNAIGAIAASFDEIIVYDKALSQAEVTALYNGGAPITITSYTNVLAHYACNSTSGSTMVDSSGNGRDILLNGGTAPTWGPGIASSAPQAPSDVPINRITNNAIQNSYGNYTQGYFSGIYGTSNIYEGLTHKFNLLGVSKLTLSGTTLAMTGAITASTSIGATTTLSAGTTVSAGTLFLGGAGAVGGPTFSFTGDPNTGIYSGGSDILKLVTAGTNRINVIATGLVAIGDITPTSTLHNSGSMAFAYRAITALRTLDATDYVIDCTANTFAVTLPTAASITGRVYKIKNSGAGVITINTTSSQTIDGAASGTITLAQYDCKTVMSNGANWIILK